MAIKVNMHFYSFTIIQYIKQNILYNVTCVDRILRAGIKVFFLFKLFLSMEMFFKLVECQKNKEGT